MLQLVFVLAAALAAAMPLTTSLKYKIPTAMLKVMLEDDSCISPSGFEIEGFGLFAPGPNNTASPRIDFTFVDVATNINTPCHYNTSSVNVGPAGLTPRWACDNNIVSFIWEDDTVTVIEKACPQDNQPGTVGFEASGSVTPDLTCYKTDTNSTDGDGITCSSNQQEIDAPFTSLQPTPP
ncbi:hypothetical protein B0H66DRAFT_596978 [Apodospora peruviana]|uniref:AA1-like domain-containing protein n=1 Tax=Apodospora peruviana TaxID=516989 RepID=A0AAE0IQK2_9PEZI|nr:hypothetical protein B0H66DRAFT_596978 [Apodospora peruviana]